MVAPRISPHLRVCLWVAAMLQLVGSLLAVGIPLIAAIGPITGALGKNLRDALDISYWQRSDGGLASRWGQALPAAWREAD